MKLEHIALNVTDSREISSFYQDILGMREVNRFSLQQDLCMKIFGINKGIEVSQLEKEDLFIEIFIGQSPAARGFQHICISVPDREAIIEKVLGQEFRCIRLKRGHSDLVFIGDHSGNLIELKQYSEKG